MYLKCPEVASATGAKRAFNAIGDDFFRIFIFLPLLRVLVDTLRMNIHERMKR